MLYKALVSFSGKISMVTDEVREIPDPAVADDLVRAGYIEPVKEEKKKKKTP